MVICGDIPLTSSLIYIVAEKVVLMEAEELSLAMELLFGLHYVMNLKYCDQCKNTYLFYQKFIMEISDKEKIPTKLITFVSKLK